MPVLKNKTQGRFVTVNRNIVEDKDLRLVDRGLLLTLLSLPDNWDFSIKGMTHILPEGKAAISASFERLKRRGYIRKEQIRDESGRFAETAIEVFDVPFKPSAENRSTEKRTTVKRQTDNRTQLNNKESNNNRLKNKGLVRAEKKYPGKDDRGKGRSKDNGHGSEGISGNERSAEINLYGFPVSDL